MWLSVPAEQHCLWKLLRAAKCFEAEKNTYHVREEVGGMFIEADDSLPQLVSPQAIREGPQLPLHFWPWIHVGEQLPERQPVGHMEVSYTTCCSEKAWMDLSLWLPKCLQSFSRCSLDPQVHHCYYWYHNNPQDYPSGKKTRQEILISTNLDVDVWIWR